MIWMTETDFVNLQSKLRQAELDLTKIKRLVDPLVRVVGLMIDDLDDLSCAQSTDEEPKP